jgi:thiol-disulfide isomerase/thioredoxin
VRRAVGGALLILAAAVSACSNTPNVAQPDPSFAPNPHRSELVLTAGLDPCPSSVAAAAAGGLPEVTLPCLGAGPAVRLAGLRGKPTVVNIWGSWCTPCQKETTYLSTVYDAMKEKVRFLGVDDEDDPSSALDFAPHVTPPMRYPSVVDSNKAVLIAMHTSAVPITLYVDATGKVVHRNFGPYADVASLRADIGRYLGVHG